MRCRTIIIGGLLLIGLCARAVRAQVSGAGDLDPSGRVLAKIRIRVTDTGGVPRSVSRFRVLFVSEKGDQVSIETDAAGIATAWLEAGSYRLVTPDALSFGGKSFKWDLVVLISPGAGAITLSDVNAKPVEPAAVTPEQSATAGQTQAGRKNLRVFVDCQISSGCDVDYFRNEIPFVDYMRDRADASVHILITGQRTGGGGLTYTLNFIGQRDLAGKSDTASVDVPQTATDDDRRKALVHVMKLGLVRYVMRTPGGEHLQLSFNQAIVNARPSSDPALDPWNLWVFSTAASGSFQGEDSRRFMWLRGSSSANRTSKEWKLHLGLNGGYNESRYTFNDGSKYSDFTHSYGVSHLLVKSLGDNWGVGERASLSSSTYLNQKLFLSFAPTVEYNFFPYSQSTRRRFTIAYSVGANSFNYEDTTIFEKINEFRPSQTITAALGLRQPWGSVSISVEGAAFLDDFSKQHATLYNELDLRLFKGFSLNTYAGFTMLRDQLYLAKGGLTDEEILLQRRQLESRYSYYGGIGLSYTFGSIFNNVVNPRFDALK